MIARAGDVLPTSCSPWFANSASFDKPVFSGSFCIIVTWHVMVSQRIQVYVNVFCLIEIVEISQKLYTDVLGVNDSELAARQVRILLRGSDCWLVTVWPQSHHKLPGSCRLQSSSWLQLQYFTIVKVGGWGFGILISPDYQRRKLVSSVMKSYLGIKRLRWSRYQTSDMIRWPGSYLTISRCRRWGTLNTCFSNRIRRSAKCGARQNSTPRANWSSNQLLGDLCLIEDTNQCKGMVLGGNAPNLETWPVTIGIFITGVNRDTLKNFPVKLEGQHQHNAGNPKLKWLIRSGAWKFHHFWNVF